jgi:cytochrome c-type biogenesis protein CcmH
METDRTNGLLSEAQYQSAKQELEARLADDALTPEDAPIPGRVSSRKLGYTLGAVLPVAAFALYFWLGNPAAVMAIADVQTGTAQSAVAGAAGEQNFMKLIRKVEEKTQANPDDGEAWAMLARSYAAMEQWPKALSAYEKAIMLLSQDASLLSGYAEVLAITNDRVLTGKPMELVRKALEIDPEDMKALELAGINAFQEGGFAQASAYLKHLHSLLPPASPYTRYAAGS